MSRQNQRALLGVCYGEGLREKGGRRVCGFGVSIVYVVGWFYVCLIVSVRWCSCMWKSECMCWVCDCRLQCGVFSLVLGGEELERERVRRVVWSRR